MVYGFINTYAKNTPVNPGDLNRRADVIQSQLPGALTALGAGAFGLTDLLVNSPTAGQIAPGGTLVLNSDSVLVYVELPEAVSIPARTDEAFLHLALRVPSEILGPTDTAGTDSRRGAVPMILLSENETETDALLLATWNGTVWIDARPLSLPAQFAQAQADIGYDVDERAKGSLADRLNALSIPIDPSGDFPSAAVILQLQNDLAQAQADIALLKAQQANSDAYADSDFPSDLEQMMDEIAINRAGLAEVNPTSIERGQISVVVANAGHGQFDGPDYSPTTGDPNELVFNIADGTFGA